MTTLYDTLKPEDREKRLYKELIGKYLMKLMKENKGVWHG